jgi:hypothetical protein
MMEDRMPPPPSDSSPPSANEKASDDPAEGAEEEDFPISAAETWFTAASTSENKAADFLNLFFATSLEVLLQCADWNEFA